MVNVKSIVSVCMGAVLSAYCMIALCSDLSISLKCFAVTAGVYGFFELRKWRNRKE